MTQRMLIDAMHDEETRVVVVDGDRIKEFDSETAGLNLLKGNIYLAEVVRVEPSLQAAFVEYGGNRHGFLSFGEIHPDYFRIPVEDREKMLEGIRAADMAAEDADGDAGNGDAVAEDGDDGEVEAMSAAAAETVAEIGDSGTDEGRENSGNGETGSASSATVLPARFRNRYKIQEVIKRRQVMLVQVAKEERGSKGVALTTYISLAGRYCVLMPNESRGGVSRKITDPKDRRRLKEMVAEFGLPEGMSLIFRTAGAGRTKAEIRRDYDYLINLWEDVRARTLNSVAPAMIHEEGNLVKRAIRDLYSKDMEEVLVQGEEAYETARDFMKTLIPSHARKVQRYEDDALPLLRQYKVEEQLLAVHSPTVRLPSGGYIVVHQTEALVAIDVNSGRAMSARKVEDTALTTNLEAASEIAIQLSLRDLGGLIVIDFIDMESAQNNRAVESRIKEALRHDRARVQFGRISTFGLFEMSRQRLRPSLMETTGLPCRHCNGTGYLPTPEWTALQVLKAIEEEGMRGASGALTVSAAPDVALYLMNRKRSELSDIEQRHGVVVTVAISHEGIENGYCVIESDSGTAGRTRSREREALRGEKGLARPEAMEPARRSRTGGRRRGSGRDAGGEARGGPRESERGRQDEEASEDRQQDQRRSRSRRRGRGRRPAGDDGAMPGSRPSQEEAGAGRRRRERSSASSGNATASGRRQRGGGKVDADQPDKKKAPERKSWWRLLGF